MAKGKRIREPSGNQGRLIQSQEPPDYDSHPPLFSLERLQSGHYCLSSMDAEGKAAFADAIFRRRSLSWKEIRQAPRHGLGTEKIARSSIKAAIPPFITDEITDFLAFRYHGKRPMVGYRLRDVFFVLWLDRDFTLYDHGG